MTIQSFPSLLLRKTVNKPKTFDHTRRIREMRKIYKCAVCPISIKRKWDKMHKFMIDLCYKPDILIIIRHICWLFFKI